MIRIALIAAAMLLGSLTAGDCQMSMKGVGPAASGTGATYLLVDAGIVLLVNTGVRLLTQ